MSIFIKIELLLLSCIVGYIFWTFWCGTFVKKFGALRIKGYHFHHTLFIVPGILAVILFKTDLSLFFLSSCIGAMMHDFFVHHNKKLKFITRD